MEELLNKLKRLDNAEDSLKQNNKPFSKKVHNLLQQKHLRNLQKEKEVGNWLYALGMDLKSGRSENDFPMLEKLESCLSKIEQFDWSLNWALEPSMLALVQARFLEHPSERVKLIAASCFSDILRIATPFPPYNDDFMKRIFRLIVGTFQDLDNSAGPTFGKKLEILGGMATFSTYDIMFDLECDGLILQMFQCFFSIRRHHPDTVIAHMQSILSSSMGDHEAICRKLRTRLLSIWRREQLVSPAAYELAQGLVEQNIRLFRRQLTR